MKKIITLLFLSCWCLNAESATLTVCPSGCGYTTITAALAAASSGDIIYVNVNGNHTENGILINKNVTIKGNGKSTTFIQAAATRLTAADRVFNIPRTQSGGTLDNALTITFQDITIQNGYAAFLAAGQNSFGGGVQINNGNGTVVNFINVDFKNNDTRSSCATTCSNGGGAGLYMSCTSGSATLFNNVVNVNLTNCTFDDNNTGGAAANSSGSGQQGGAMTMNGNGTLTVKNCVFKNNTAFTSGGVLYTGAAVTGSFTDCVFESNNVTEAAVTPNGSSFSGSAGGLYLRSSSFDFTNCMFKNNSSPSIGGAVTTGANSTFTNCTFYGNSSQYGGAVYRSNNGSSPTVSTAAFVNCTFSGNSASGLGRAIVVGTHGGTTTAVINLALINTIVNTNNGTAPSDIYFSTDFSRLSVNQKNYVNSVSAAAGTAPTFDYNSGNATLGLLTPANNGGTIETMALDNTSTLVDKGTNNVSGYTIPVKDCRNYSRTDAAVDLGAYEKAGIIDDVTAPAITYTALANTPLTTNRTLSATITDANGVYPWTSLVPRIYFKKGSGTWQSTAGVLSSGTGRNGTWTFTIDNSLMGGVAGGNQIYYYVIAQDVSSTPTIVSQPSGATATNVNSVTSPPGTPDSYLIGSACTDPTVPTLGASSSTICAGGSATLSITAGTLNDATAWKWYSGSCGGTAEGTGTSISVSPTTTTTYYARGEGGCVTPGTCASVTVTVTPAVVPSVSITSSDADNKICAGASVTFTPTPTNGGTTPAYQWKLNGSNVSTGATYTTAALVNNDEVTVELTSNAVCASPLTATSNAIKTTVDAVAVPSVSIASSDADNKICAGASVTFTPTPTNGGTTPGYQWKVNGTNVSTAATYVTTTLVNNDEVTVVLTSNALCAAPLTATSNAIKTTVDAVVVPSVSIASSDADNKICAGASVTFTPTPTNGGTTPGYQWKVNGTNVSTAATYVTTALVNNDEVTVVLTSNALCASPLTATSNAIKTTVDPVLVPSVTIASSDVDNKICAGTSVTFTPTPANGGTTPTYQWKVNGTNASTGSTYTTMALLNNDQVTVVLTSNALCATPATATSSAIQTTVDPVLVPSVTIASSDADNKICDGASITFTPTPANGGTTPSYQWKLNGTNVSTAASYTTAALVNNDQVTVVLTSNALCAAPLTATSNAIKTTVDPILAPSVSIASSDADNKICDGTSVTFTPTPTNGGTTPTYQWKLNGTNVSTAATYITTALVNNDEVTVVLTSNASCVSPLTATSNAIKTTVDAIVVPSISIASSDGDNKICAGTSVTFTPTPSNGGTTPAYQWKVNGTNTSTGLTYTTTALLNNDQVTVVLTSNALCATPATVTSNAIKTTVDPVLVPSVTIASSDADNKICDGASVTFTPTPANGGTTPTYQWKLNGTNVSTAASYTTAALVNNDQVTVVLTSNALCAAPLTATSNAIKTTVDPIFAPSVTITSSDADNKICAGTSVTFTPTPANGGTTPTYQWKLNGSNVSTAATYTTTALVNNDEITVVLTSNASCAAPLTATSNAIKTTVDPVLVPSVTIASSDADDKICAGTSVTFTATPNNGGTTPTYQWKVNGTNASTGATYTTAALVNNDQVTVILSSNALCATPATATSNAIKTTVDPVLVPSVTIASSDADNKICAGISVTFTPTPINGGTTPTYQWKLNGTNVSTATSYTTTSLVNNDEVTVVLTSNALCAAPATATSNAIKTTVDPVLVPSVTIASSDADNKICAGTSVTFTPTPANGGTTPMYQWKVNGTNVSTSATYVTTALVNNDEVTVVLTSNALCAAPLTATSNAIKTTVDPVLVPSVTIAADDADNEICAGTSVIFTPTPINGGATPTYQWKINGTNASTGSTFTSAALVNNDQVTAVLTSNALCAAPLTATSNAVKVKVNPVLTPAVTIVSDDADNSICDGKMVTFTPTPVNGGSTPTYEWKINGNSVSTNTIFTSIKLVNGDVVSVVLTSNSICVSSATAVSNPITIKVNQPSTGTITKTACDKYLFNNIEQTVSGIYKDTLVNGGGCDSIVTLNLTIHHSNSYTLVKIACDSFRLNNVNYTSSGSYKQVVTNQAGCDSTINLNLTINHSSSYTWTAKACDSIFFDNKKYTTSGTYTAILKNKAGCDSIVTLHLTIPKSNGSLIVKTACDKYLFNNIEQTVSGVYKDTLVNGAGCDSIITLNLTIHHSNSYTLVKTACNSFTLNNQTYTASGTYMQTIKNAAGCDSVITLQLTIKSGTNTGSTITATACDKYLLNNQTYTSSGTYTQVLTNAGGCDSTLTLKLTINHSTTHTLTDTACDRYTLNGQVYTTSGTYTQVLKNTAGCDSTLTLHLTITNLSATVTVASNVLTASPGGGVYQWLDCNEDNTIIPGATAQVYTASVSGMYAVRIILGKCIDTSACYSVIVTGLEELFKQTSDILVYPNPNRGSFTLQSKTEGTFYLVNELGQSVSKFILNSANNYTVKVNNIGMGIYYIQGGNATNHVRRKLVVTE